MRNARLRRSTEDTQLFSPRVGGKTWARRRAPEPQAPKRKV